MYIIVTNAKFFFIILDNDKLNKKFHELLLISQLENLIITHKQWQTSTKV